MIEIVKMIFGSHLYGTNTEDSDLDFKGVFLPSREEVLLGRIQKVVGSCTKEGSGKNTKDDVDTEYFSLHYFIELACQGQTVALDMLHAPDNMIIFEKPTIWGAIRNERARFYTKNLDAFVGYARKQASKYGVKGSRLNAAKEVLDYFKILLPQTKLMDVWDALPMGEHIQKHDIEIPRMYEVCGRQIQETCKVEYAKSIIQKYYDNYGARAEAAARNEGVDWKAVSHALRAAYQVEQILTEGTIIFPLKEAVLLKQVKAGELDYTTVVAPMLDSLIINVEQLALKSNLPEEVDRAYWDDFIMRIVDRYVVSPGVSSV